MIADIKVISGSMGVVKNLTVDDRTTSSVTTNIQPGEVVKRNTPSDNRLIPILTGDGEQGTDIIVGVAHNQSTETLTVDGVVDVELIGPGSRLRGKATTASNMNTAALLTGILMDFVCFDVASSSGTNGIMTIDEDEGDDPNVHGLFIYGGDPIAGTLDVLFAAAGIFGSTV